MICPSVKKHHGMFSGLWLSKKSCAILKISDIMSKKTIIIGAGVAGLAAAVRLAVAGHEVTVFEASDGPGGKLSQFSLGAYRFDFGPSLFTMPQFVEELFTLSGKKMEDYFSYVKSDTACHYFFEDGTFLPFSADKKKLLSEIESRLGIDPKPFEKHLGYLQQESLKS